MVLEKLVTERAFHFSQVGGVEGAGGEVVDLRRTEAPTVELEAGEPTHQPAPGPFLTVLPGANSDWAFKPTLASLT